MNRKFFLISVGAVLATVLLLVISIQFLKAPTQERQLATPVIYITFAPTATSQANLTTQPQLTPITTPSVFDTSLTITPSKVSTRSIEPLLLLTSTITVTKEISKSEINLAASFKFSPLRDNGNLTNAYPLRKITPHFYINYQKASRAEREIEDIARFIEKTFDTLSQNLVVTMTEKVHVYLANSLFIPPSHGLRGRAYPNPPSIFVLYDEYLSETEARYIIAHELTHVLAWSGYGAANSVLISEGLAVHAGEPFLREDNFASISLFCSSYRAVQKMPILASPATQYSGHTLSLDAYYAAGCFTRYLINTYGIEKIAAIYTNSDFKRVYGKTLGELEKEWLLFVDKSMSQSQVNEKLPDRYEDFRKKLVAFLNKSQNGKPDIAEYERLIREWTKLIATGE